MFWGIMIQSIILDDILLMQSVEKQSDKTEKVTLGHKIWVISLCLLKYENKNKFI